MGGFFVAIGNRGGKVVRVFACFFLILFCFSDLSPPLLAKKNRPAVVPTRDTVPQNIRPSPPASKPPINEMPGIHPEALNLLRKAKDLYSNQQIEEARKLISKARIYSPHLPIPAWFSPLPEVEREKRTLHPPNGTHVHPGAQNQFEARLNRNPNDLEARKNLLRIAVDKGDQFSINRHKVILGIEPEESQDVWVYVAIFALLGGLILWQGIGFWKELKERS